MHVQFLHHDEVSGQAISAKEHSNSYIQRRNLKKAVATAPVPVLKLEYQHHIFVWGVVTHAQ